MLGGTSERFVKENSLVCEMCNFTHQQKTKKRQVHILHKTKYGNEIGNPEFDLHVHNIPRQKKCPIFLNRLNSDNI